MNMVLDPFCEYCDLKNTGIDLAFCPEEDAIHILEDCSSFTSVRIGHFEDFKTNLEDILHQKIQLTTALQRIEKFFEKSGCSTKGPKKLFVSQVPFCGWDLLFVPSITLYILYSTRGIHFQSGRSRPLCRSVRLREMANIAVTSADIQLNLLTSLTCTACSFIPPPLQKGRMVFSNLLN